MEFVTLVPVGLVSWFLLKKVGDQNSIIQSQEQTIHTQREILEYIQQRQKRSSTVGLGVAVVMASGCWTAYRYATRHRHRGSRSGRSSVDSRRTEIVGSASPPVNYEPTTATSPQEECMLCLSNKRDSVLYPCRHLAICWPCKERLGAHWVPGGGAFNCPVCRQRVISAEYVYIP